MGVVYISLTKLGVLTIITGIFTTSAMRIAEEDNMFIMQDFVKELVRVTDANRDGAITWEELSLHLEHPILIEFFPDLSGRPEGAERIFNKMDADGSGEVSVEEFCQELA